MTKESINILIVEDENLIAQQIQRCLQDNGYMVAATVSSGEEALEKVKNLKPDLVIMDILLQGELDGIQTAGYIHSNYGIPVIFLTAHSDSKFLENAKIAEPFGYLIKPFQEAELISTIEMAYHKYQVEKKLKESEQWFHTALKCIGDAVIALDKEGNVKFINQAAEYLTEWKMEEAIGKPISKIVSISDEQLKTELNNPSSNMMNRNTITELSMDSLLITKHGQKIPIAGSIGIIKDDKGDFFGIALVLRDISRQIQVEESRIKEQSETLQIKNFLDNILNSISSGLLVLKEDNTIELINKAGRNILGISGEVEGKSITELSPDLAILSDTSKHKPTDNEVLVTTVLGRKFPLGFNSAEISAFEGDQKRIITVFRDLTEKKAMAKKLREKEKLAYTGEIARGIAHEIKNPIFTISGNIHILLRDNKLDENVSRIFEVMYKEIMRVNRLIEQLIFYSSEKMDIDIIQTETLFDEIIALNEQILKEREIKVIKTVYAEDHCINGDRDKILQVFVNIFQNAIEASTANDTIEIILQQDDEDQLSLISICDQGGGIEEKHRGYVFDPFFSTKKAKSGMGLSISKKIALAHGGDIKIEEQEPHGTKVTVMLPMPEKPLQDFEMS